MPRINCLISILRIMLPVMSFGFFGQIFLLLTTFFDCQNGNSYVSTQLKCRTGNWFIYFFPFIVLAIILHICVALLTNLLYYKSIFIPSYSDVLQKTTSMPDISLIVAKIGIILTFIFDNSEEREHWAMLFFLILFSGINVYTNIFYNHRLNRLIFMLNIIFSLISFVGFFILFLGKVFKSLGYDGSIFLYSIIIIIIFLFVFLYKNKDFEFVLTDYQSLSNPEEYMNYVIKYFKIIMHKDNSRNYSSILKSYISIIEETCTLVDCPLKNYLKSLEEGNDSKYLLLKHLEKIFKYGISKFKNDPMLKNAYSMFLLIQMNHKKQAMIELKTISDEQISFNRRYSIYRCKKLIEKWSVQNSSYYFHYRMDANIFKELILKATTLYYEFWSLLYESKFQHSDNFTRLFKIGNEIMDLDKKIDDLYQVLIKIKTNNLEIYKLYNEFIENILKNEVKSNKIQKSKNSIFSGTFENEEKNYTNFNVGYLKENDAVRYILISGAKKNLGTILDCSISACMVFGYTKGELIGKHLNIFIPEIFHCKHNAILSTQSNINNFKLFDDLYQKKEYNPAFVEGFFFGVFKSKFIKNLKLKVYFIKTEENIVTFVVEILKDIPYMSELVKDRNMPYCNIDERCCVLTDENFLIYSFTANSVEKLGLSYRNVKSKNSIIPYIKQLYTDYLNSINDININANINTNSNSKNEMISVESSRLSERKINSKVSYEVKQKIKKDLINKKYGKKCQITWYLNKKINSNKNKGKNEESTEINGKCSRISYRDSCYNFAQNKSSNEKRYEKEFLMEIRKAILDNRLLGYYFFFSKIYNLESKNFMMYNSLNNQKENDKGEELKKLIKYKVIFKTPQKASFINNEQSQKINKVSNTDINSFNTNDISKDYDKNLSNISKINEDSNISFVDNKKNPLYSYMEINVQKVHKYSSAIGISDNSAEEIVVNENFIPKSRINFNFDIDNMCYNLEKDTNKSNLLNLSLQKIAFAKIKEYHEYLKSTKKNKILDLTKSNDSENEDSSNSDVDVEDEEEEEEDESLSKASILENNKDDINIRKSFTFKNRASSQMEEVSPVFGKSSTLRPIKETEDKNSDKIKKDIIKISSNNSLQVIKKAQGKEIISNYYKVNLSNMHFMIFDFNKDMIVEGDKNEIIYKIDNIINSSKNKNNIINIGKDEGYPFISFKNAKEEKKNKNKVEEQNININNNINSIINEKKSFERKINDSINDKNEEEAIKILKKYSLISFVVLFIFAVLILYLNLYFFREIKNILEIIKNITYIKYTNSFGLYYIRELTLVNYDTKEINSNYTEFPAKNRTAYIYLISSKLMDLFIESQTCLKQILSSDFSPSKDTKLSLTETILNVKYMLDKNYGGIDSDIFSILLQYNTALYNIASSYVPIEENHPDLYNYMCNGYNNYEKAINIFIEKFNNELNRQKKYILIIMILCPIIFLIVFVIFCILMTQSYISSAKRRVDYMEVFFDISIDSIKDLMSNCEILMEKLKKNSGKKEEELDESIEENKSIKKNQQMEISSRNVPMINNHDNKNNTSLSISSKVFIFFYLLLMAMLYLFFPYTCITLYNISKKSTIYSEFFAKINEFHSSIIDYFNAYREFLFNNQSIIQEKLAFDFLVSSDIKTYDSMANNQKFISDFLNKNLDFDETIINISSKDLCSFAMTDYFESHQQCMKKFEYLIKYDYIIFLTHFVQDIRNLKNIVKYWHKTKNIYGNLTIYNVESWKSNKPEENAYFRLQLFNDEIIHSEANLMFFNIILPFIDQYRKEFLRRLTLEKYGLYFIIYFFLFIVCLILLYFSYILPKIRYLTNFIYKTKNMLSLIPMSILAAQSNIKSLLKLN